MFDFSRISSASISARRTTGSFRRRASSSSGLPFLIALEITTTDTPSLMFSARWPSKNVAPSFTSRSVIFDAFASDPCTR
jgi:hypothetical protein